MIRYEELQSVLAGTGIAFAEGAWKRAGAMEEDYGAYALDSTSSLMADGNHAERLMEGTIDFFSLVGRGSAKARLIEEALDTVGVPWELNLPGRYEPDTRITHWEWIFQCLP